MNKIFLILSVMAIPTCAMAVSISNPPVCAYLSDLKCLRCGGDKGVGNCTKTYAGCASGLTDVSVGYSGNGVTCTTSGFCYTYCSPQNIPYPEIEHGVQTTICSGCLCNQNCTTTITCESGYEYSGGKCNPKCRSGLESVNGQCERVCDIWQYRDENGECQDCPLSDNADYGEGYSEWNGWSDYGYDYYNSEYGSRSAKKTECYIASLLLTFPDTSHERNYKSSFGHNQQGLPVTFQDETGIYFIEPDSKCYWSED